MNVIVNALNWYILVLTERQIWLTFEQSEKEVQDLRQRIREGIETARLNDRQIGRKSGTKLTTRKPVETKERLLKYHKDFGRQLNDKEYICLLDVARGAYYCYKAELKEARLNEPESE